MYYTYISVILGLHMDCCTGYSNSISDIIYLMYVHSQLDVRQFVFLQSEYKRIV